MDLTVLKRVLDGTGKAFLLTVLIDIEALAPQQIAEVLLETAIGLDDVQILILNGDIARNLIKNQMVPILAFLEPFLQDLYLRDVGRHLQNRRDVSVLVVDGRGIHNDIDLIAIERFYNLLAPMALAIPKRTIDGAYLAFFRPMLIDLIAVTALEVTEISLEAPVRLNDLEVPVLHRQVARQGIKILVVR
jgi:hypothetical protein